MTDGQLPLPGVRSAPGRRAVAALRANADLRATRVARDPVITAVDLSYTSAGIAWLEADGHVGVTTVATHRVIDAYRCGTGMAARRAVIVQVLMARCGPGTLVVREDRLSTLHVAGSSALDLAALHGSVEDACEARGLSLASVNVGRVKIYGANSGRADKAMMVQAARREFDGLITIANDDEADALWTLAVAAHLHGLPMVRMRKRRAEVVEQCRPGWPVFAPVMPGGLRTRLRSTP